MIDTVAHSARVNMNDDKVIEKSGDIFKSNSTNTFLFNDEQTNKFDSNWSKSELLEFPQIAPQLKKERKLHRELYKTIVSNIETKQESDTAQRLRRYDVEINLQRMLYKNDKYVSLTRNKRRISDMFSNAFVSRLKHKTKLNAHDLVFEDENMNFCKRYEDHSKRYEEYYLKGIFEPTLKSDIKLPKLQEEHGAFENENTKPRALMAKQNVPVKQFLSKSINDFPAHVAQQRTSTMIESNNKITESDTNLQDQKAFDNMLKAFVSSSMPVLKPKQQVVNASIKRKSLLPPINNKQTENASKNEEQKAKEKKDDNDDDDDLDSVFDKDE